MKRVLSLCLAVCFCILASCTVTPPDESSSDDSSHKVSSTYDHLWEDSSSSADFAYSTQPESSNSESVSSKEAISKPVSTVQSKTNTATSKKPVSSIAPQKPASSKPASQSKPATNSKAGEQSKTAYWTPSGKSYHFSRNCTSLKRSKTVLSGTLQDALNAGKKDPCNLCAGGK